MATDPRHDVPLPFDIKERLLSKIRVVGDCWLWTGALTNGYAAIGWWHEGRAKMFHAHVIAYRAWSGQPARGTHGHHTCGVRSCINPSHVAMLPQREHNALHVRTHCKRGHLLAETAIPNGTQPSGRPARTCGVCRRLQWAA